MTSIIITIADSDEERIIRTYSGEYRNLKDLISDQFYLDNFGECGGMGRCATCMVEITGLTGDSAMMQRNEETTLGRFAKGSNAKVRLACQIEIDDCLANTRIKIIDSV